jgi:hypothetical protein
MFHHTKMYHYFVCCNELSIVLTRTCKCVQQIRLILGSVYVRVILSEEIPSKSLVFATCFSSSLKLKMLTIIA